MKKNKKYVYTFGDGQAEGNAKMKNLLGGKGANLAEMNLVGIPVPPGFTLTTEVCTLYNKNGKSYTLKLIKAQVTAAVKYLEKVMNTSFGDPKNLTLHFALYRLTKMFSFRALLSHLSPRCRVQD